MSGDHMTMTAALSNYIFSDDSLDEVPVAIPSRGSGLFAGTVSTKLILAPNSNPCIKNQ